MASGAESVIHYVTNYGTRPNSVECSTLDTLTSTELPTLYAEGYKFLGWYLSNDYNPSTKLEVGRSLYYDYGRSMEGDIVTFYAYWVENKSFLIQEFSLTSIADKIRVLSGTTGAMSLDAMETNVGDANTEISSQSDLLTQVITALEDKAAGSDLTPIVDALTEKGVTVPDGTKVDGLAALIAAIEAGGAGGDFDFSAIGGTKAVSGSITIAETIYRLHIEHNLGFKPKILGFYTTTKDIVHNSAAAACYYGFAVIDPDNAIENTSFHCHAYHSAGSTYTTGSTAVAIANYYENKNGIEIYGKSNGLLGCSNTHFTFGVVNSTHTNLAFPEGATYEWVVIG